MRPLKPFFCFYGGKWRTARHYPQPRYSKIIEPFAGSAGYSVYHYWLSVELYDIDPIIFGVWDYLIRSSRNEIYSLPLIINSVDELSVCQEAKWLIGFWLNKATAYPSKIPGKWMRSNIRPKSHWGKEIRDRIAEQSQCIKHWKIFNTTYDNTENQEATWFIDPPYEQSGKHYRFHKISYSDLAIFCLSRYGQIIVCEQEGSQWLSFSEFRTIKSTEGSRGKKTSKEVIWHKP